MTQTTSPATVRRVLQRVVLPVDRDTDVLPLYVDPDRPQLDVNTLGMTLKQRGRILLSNMDSADPIAMCMSRYL